MTEPVENNEAAENVVPFAEPDPASSPVAALQAEVASLKDQALRAMAEAENTRKRAAKERDDAMKYGTTALAKDLLGVADNLRRALEHAGTLEGEAARNFVAGVEAIERQMLGAFDRCGIKKVDPLGQKLDPNFHRVMMEVEAPAGTPAGTVVQVLQSGYVIHDRLLREALVAVAKGDTPAAHGVDTQA